MGEVARRASLLILATAEEASPEGQPRSNFMHAFQLIQQLWAKNFYSTYKDVNSCARVHLGIQPSEDRMGLFHPKDKFFPKILFFFFQRFHLKIRKMELDIEYYRIFWIFRNDSGLFDPGDNFFTKISFFKTFYFGIKQM